jgi:hypothetical protein
MSLRKVLLAVLALLVLAAAWVRLAPADLARWHVHVASDAPPLCAEGIERGAASARAACLSSDPPAMLLARLDVAAMASPRTRRIAGTPEEGRITWETRSLLMGYPDYTTAQAVQTDTGSRLDILARSRFGMGDWGVNAARLADWLKPL